MTLTFMTSLILPGDIEINPGPLNITGNVSIRPSSSEGTTCSYCNKNVDRLESHLKGSHQDILSQTNSTKLSVHVNEEHRKVEHQV